MFEEEITQQIINDIVENGDNIRKVLIMSPSHRTFLLKKYRQAVYAPDDRKQIFTLFNNKKIRKNVEKEVNLKLGTNYKIIKEESLCENIICIREYMS